MVGESFLAGRVSEAKPSKWKKVVFVPTVLATFLTAAVYLLMPELGFKPYIATWFGTFAVWYIWVAVMSLY